MKAAVENKGEILNYRGPEAQDFLDYANWVCVLCSMVVLLFSLTSLC